MELSEVIVSHSETALRMLVSFMIGALIGFEREYHSKAAGLRTMIMICFGSTVFTVISNSLGENSDDRIASNIITGIGFLGAGVIFKDGLTISGITTATTIWICAALGMAAGAGQYFIAILGTCIVLLILSALQSVTRKIEKFHQARTYRLTYDGGQATLTAIENQFRNTNVKFDQKKDLKENGNMIVIYELYGGEEKLNQINDYLKSESRIKSFEY